MSYKFKKDFYKRDYLSRNDLEFKQIFLVGDLNTLLAKLVIQESLSLQKPLIMKNKVMVTCKRKQAFYLFLKQHYIFKKNINATFKATNIFQVSLRTFEEIFEFTENLDVQENFDYLPLQIQLFSYDKKKSLFFRQIF